MIKFCMRSRHQSEHRTYIVICKAHAASGLNSSHKEYNMLNNNVETGYYIDPDMHTKFIGTDQVPSSLFTCFECIVSTANGQDFGIIPIWRRLVGCLVWPLATWHWSVCQCIMMYHDPRYKFPHCRLHTRPCESCIKHISQQVTAHGILCACLWMVWTWRSARRRRGVVMVLKYYITVPSSNFIFSLSYWMFFNSHENDYLIPDASVRRAWEDAMNVSISRSAHLILTATRYTQCDMCFMRMHKDAQTIRTME